MFKIHVLHQHKSTRYGLQTQANSLESIHFAEATVVGAKLD